MNFEVWSKNRALLIVVLIIVLLQLLISFQGFDFCDEGWSLTFYQQFFNTPESVEYNFVYWLSGLLGGGWYKLYEDGGILWFRFLAIIINTSTFIVSYKILVNYINKWHALIGLCMVIFINDFGYMVFYHNHLTALLVVVSVYFLTEGLINNNNVYVGFSGLIFSINIFSRVPNIFLFTIVTSIPFYYSYLKNEPLKRNFKPILIYIFGSILGLILIFVMLLNLNQLHIMQNSISGIIDLGEASDSNHNFLKLIKVTYFTYKKVLLTFFKIVIMSLFSIIIWKKVSHYKILKLLLILVVSTLFFLLIKTNSIVVIYGYLIFGVFGILLCVKKSNLKLLSLCALMIAILVPFGSDGSIYNIGYASIWLAFPLFFHFFFTEEVFTYVFKTKIKTIEFSTSFTNLKPILVIFTFVYFISKIYNISQEAYFDKGNRFDKTYAINNKLAKHIYTTKLRADIVNDLLRNIKSFVNPDDVLFVYDNIPMIHFLTKTKPYVYNPWVWIYDANSFRKNLNRALLDNESLPIIIQQKFETIMELSDPVEDYMSENKENDFKYNSGRVKAMNLFIKENNYKIVWSNAYFNIYKSNNNKN